MVSFPREKCAGYPYQMKCRPKIHKRVAKIVTSKAAHGRAVIQRSMKSEEFKNYARLRNGAETVPSNQLCEGARPLCQKSGIGIKRGREYLSISRRSPVIYYKI